MSVLLYAWVLAIGVGVCQDAIASILYYLHRDDESWHYNHACRLLRLGGGLALIIISSIALGGL